MILLIYPSSFSILIMDESQQLEKCASPKAGNIKYPTLLQRRTAGEVIKSVI